MVGLDVGTMNLISAYQNDSEIVFNTIRDAFIKIDSSQVGAVDLSKINHAYIDDELYILGSDAFNFANIFGQTVNRPMSKGLISPSEIDAVDVLGVLIKSILPSPSQESARCVYSCPANSTDSQNDIVYHREVLKNMISSLGYTPVPINEALAIIYSNCKESNFTGIAISFGAGMTNVCLAYKSVPIFEFSLERGGDWIDYNVSLATNVVPNRVCSIKETPDFNIINWSSGVKKKREKRIREALSYYYRELIDYTCKSISENLSNIGEVQLPEEVPVIISGGTSTISGFVDLTVSKFNDYIDEFPFDISSITHAVDPLNAVAHGCFIKSSLE